MHCSLGDTYNDLKMYKEAIVELELAIAIREHLNPGPAGEVMRGKNHKTLADLYEKIGVSDWGNGERLSILKPAFMEFVLAFENLRNVHLLWSSRCIL